MSAALEATEFLADIAAEVVADLVLRAGRKGGRRLITPLERVPHDALRAAVDEACVAMNDVNSIDDALGGERLRKVLLSNDFREIGRQVFAHQIHGGKATELHKSCAMLLARLTDLGPEQAREAADRLLVAVSTSTKLVLEAEIKDGSLPALYATEAARTGAILAELNNLSDAVKSLAARDAADLAAFDAWELEYREMLASSLAELTPPDATGRARSVPFDALYVEPEFGGAVDGLECLSESLHRTVVLGAPGAGKSTLGQALVLRAAREPSNGPAWARTPFVVVVREYSKARRTRSIVEHVEDFARTTLQLPAPAGAVDHLLRHGRAMVLFDGLDEIVASARRRDIASLIENFARVYPTAPVLVTSRIVGYEEAPLGATDWERVELQGFDPRSVETYVRRWLATDPTPREDLEDRAKRLVAALEDVPDLATSPLMLALICSVSLHGRREIPRSRPAVYEACAKLLFERWDQEREIEVLLPIERHLRPVLDHLAHWIHESSSREAGVPRRAIVGSIVDYLYPRRFADRDEAQLAAEQFCDFCTGRAWVFSDTGRTARDEPLFEFTHRTFLEYFTARSLTRAASTPRDFAHAMVHRIARAEMDVVAQIAFQLIDVDRADAADEMLQVLLDVSQGLSRDERWNVESFAARSLAFLVPSPKVAGILTQRIAEHCARWIWQPSERSEPTPAHAVAQLTRAGREVRPAIRDALNEWFSAYLDRAAPRLVAGAWSMVTHLEVLVDAAYAPAPAPPEALRYWRDASAHIADQNSKGLVAYALSDLPIGLTVALRDTAAVDGILKTFGPHDFLVPRYLAASRDLRLPSAAESLLGCHLSDDRTPAEVSRASSSRFLRSLAQAWLDRQLPWVRRKYPLDVSARASRDLYDDGWAGAGALFLALPQLELVGGDRKAALKDHLQQWWPDREPGTWISRLPDPVQDFLQRWSDQEFSVARVPGTAGTRRGM